MTNIEMKDQLIDYMDERFKRVEEKIENSILTHRINCPVAKEVKEIKEEQAKWLLVKKYPGLIATAFVVYGLAIVILFFVKIGVIS